MPQFAIKGIYRDGKIIPLENVQIQETMKVIIVFTEEYNYDEERYYKQDWQLAEKKASEDYKIGNVQSADTIDQMFNEMDNNFNGS
ncbi:DUF104 domain-containing protein [Candidatus Magnetomoraceae bacterium gMMP-15]